MNKPAIEIVPWVVFNTSGVKEEIMKMSKEASSVMNLATEIKKVYDLSLSDATVVAKKFYKK